MMWYKANPSHEDWFSSAIGIEDVGFADWLSLM